MKIMNECYLCGEPFDNKVCQHEEHLAGLLTHVSNNLVLQKKDDVPFQQVCDQVTNLYQFFEIGEDSEEFRAKAYRRIYIENGEVKFYIRELLSESHIKKANQLNKEYGYKK